MNYIFNITNSKTWKLSSLNEKTDFVVGKYGQVCSMEEVVDNQISCDLQCFVDITDNIDEFKRTHPYHIETGRKEFVRIFFSPDFRESHVFLSSNNIENENLKYLSTNYISRAYQIQIIKNFKATPCHCALVEINGKGAIIGAVGNTGKSTCAARLPAPHKALCDDYAMLFFQDNKIFAQAMPTWSNFINGNRDYRSDCSQSTEVEAFFFLKHGEDDHTERVKGYTSLQHLNNNFQDHLSVRVLKDKPANFGEDMRLQIFDLARETVATKPTYMLYATLEGDFWNKMAEVMGGS
jgi:SynChlorMet cassette protein ScmC